MSELKKSKIEQLYDSYVNGFLSTVRSNEFYDYFVNMIQSGSINMSLYEKFIERRIDMNWVEMIEDAIIPLDQVVRNPIRYIKNEEEIIPIEQARQITTESVKHLAQHTSMIASVKGDEVTPNRILNVRKEESLDVYENRFIYTMLAKLQYFLDKRLESLTRGSNVADKFELKFNGDTKAGNDVLKFTMDMSYETPHVDLSRDDLLLSADTSQMTSMQRVERIRKILYSFQGAPMMKELAGCALVRPPLNMTNVLTKNPNYRKIVDLWMFIERYDQVGYSVNAVERDAQPSQEFYDQLCSILTMQYVVMKRNIGSQDIGDYQERRKVVKPRQVARSIEDIMDTYDLSIDEVKHIFIDQIERKRKKLRLEFNKARDVIKRALDLEGVRFAAEEKERKIALAAEALRIKKEKAAEKKRLAREKALKAKREKARKLKALEKARIAAQKARELKKQQLAEEKAKQKQLAAQEKAKQATPTAKKKPAPKKAEPKQPTTETVVTVAVTQPEDVVSNEPAITVTEITEPENNEN